MVLGVFENDIVVAAIIGEKGKITKNTQIIIPTIVGFWTGIFTFNHY